MDVAVYTVGGGVETFQNVNWNFREQFCKKNKNRKEKAGVPSTVRQFKSALERKWKEIKQKEEEIIQLEESFVRHSLESVFKGKVVKLSGDYPNYIIPLSEAERAKCRRNLGLCSDLKTLEFGGFSISFLGRTRDGQNSLWFTLQRVGEVFTSPLTIDETITCVNSLGALKFEF
jgi:hypothetical protein